MTDGSSFFYIKPTTDYTDSHGVYLIFNVIQSGAECSEGSRGAYTMYSLLYVHEILRRLAPLDDKWMNKE